LLRNKDVDVVTISAVGSVELVSNVVLATSTGLQWVKYLLCVFKALNKVDSILSRKEWVFAC